MKLVILGNGFDLGNGLPTSYFDFFSYRFRSVESDLEKLQDLLDEKEEKNNIENRVQDAMKNSNLTFWDFYFFNSKKTYCSSNWSDIEQEMKNFLIDKNEDNTIKKGFIQSDLEKLLSSVNKLTSRFNFKYSNIDGVFYSEEEEVKINILAALILNIKYIDESLSIEEKLLKELIQFEDCFRKYIRLIMDEIINKKYKTQKIYRDNLIKIINADKSERYHVLNFNYTSIASTISGAIEGNISKTVGKVKIQRKPYEYHIFETNVHGRFDKAVIFGIDQSEVEADSKNYIFTKTYRKISYQKQLESRPIPRENSVSEIVFFGHSLAEADYAYFQSIFDFYKIYTNDIILTFKFSVYGEESGHEKIRHQQFKGITKLLKEYGKTMDNLNHGSNLVHKLLLENRLNVNEIKLRPISCEQFKKRYLSGLGNKKEDY